MSENKKEEKEKKKKEDKKLDVTSKPPERTARSMFHSNYVENSMDLDLVHVMYLNDSSKVIVECSDVYPYGETEILTVHKGQLRMSITTAVILNAQLNNLVRKLQEQTITPEEEVTEQVDQDKAKRVTAALEKVK